MSAARDTLVAEVVTTLSLGLARGAGVDELAADVVHELLEASSDTIERRAALFIAVRAARPRGDDVSRWPQQTPPEPICTCMTINHAPESLASVEDGLLWTFVVTIGCPVHWEALTARQRLLVLIERLKAGWFCVSCGAQRPRDPSVVCPRPRCGMRAYGSRPPLHPVLPAPAPERSDW